MSKIFKTNIYINTERVAINLRVLHLSLQYELQTRKDPVQLLQSQTELATNKYEEELASKTL